ncbi:MAG: hypothetical protein WKF84_19985 [Pyrinomonadaceae bacterium]
MLSPAVKNRPDGRTAGEALDAIASQLTDEENRTLVIVQKHKAEMAWWDKIAGTFQRGRSASRSHEFGLRVSFGAKIK